MYVQYILLFCIAHIDRVGAHFSYPLLPSATPGVAVNGDVYAWGYNKGLFLGVPSEVLTVPTKLAIPIPGNTIKRVQMGCVGAQWNHITRSCYLWVLSGECVTRIEHCSAMHTCTHAHMHT